MEIDYDGNQRSAINCQPIINHQLSHDSKASLVQRMLDFNAFLTTTREYDVTDTNMMVTGTEKTFYKAFGRLIWLGTLLANLLIFSMAAYVVSEDHQNSVDKAQRLTENYAKILEQNISGFIKQIDITLLNVIDEANRQAPQGGIKSNQLQTFLDQQQSRLPEALGMRIAGADGVVLFAASNIKATKSNIADREYFKHLRDDANSGIVISEPLVGRMSQKPAIIFARRINTTDGSFAGVVYVSVPVSYFINLFSKLDLGNQGNSGFWNRNSLIARFSKADPDGAKTGSTSPSPQLRQLLESDLRETSYHAKSGVDGITRIYRFHRVEPFELFLLVGLADDDYLAEWRDHSLKILALVMLFLIATLFFARQAYISWRRRELAQLELNELNSALAIRSQETEDARQKIELILASAGEGVCGVDAEGKIIFINRAGREMFGWEEGYGIGANLHALTHHHHADGQEFPVRECPISATIHDAKERHVRDDCYWRLDGSSFSVEYTVSALAKDGKVSGAVNVFRDITERKKGEAELEAYRRNLESLVEERTSALVETEARASHLLDSSAGGLYGIDRSGQITFINPAACSMLGYNAEQLIGQSAHEVLHHSRIDGSDYPASECPSYRALQLGQQIRVDNEVYWHADGHAIAVMYATHPMVKNGEITGAVTSFVDISEQRAAGEARERALIAAENLARVRSEFLANMSHEIRTPLNGVLGFADIGFRNYQNPEKAKNAFAKILGSGKRLLGVINDILDFSKIEAGKLKIEQTEVCLSEVIHQTIEILADRIQAKSLDFQLQIVPDLPVTCISDPLRIGQVLLNILSNAVKFTESGSVTLSVSYREDALLFKVTDTGIGISEGQLNELFSAFHQADASASRRFGGTGLGLAISKRIIELMGGSISAESQLGIGSTFSFSLPLLLPAATTNGIGHKEKSEIQREEKPLHGISVLVAEDEQINQLILEDNLLDDGARVVLVNNGREAFERILKDGSDAYDVVLMDLQMPEMDGYEATRHILALDPDMPIIAQTAHAFEEEREKCLAAGMIGHIAKPIIPDELVSVIRQHAKGK